MPLSKLLEVTRMVKARRARQIRLAHSLSWRFARLSIFALGILSITIAILALGAPALFAYITHDLPSVDSLPKLLDPEEGALQHATRLYDRNGALLMTYAPAGFETRTFFQASDSPMLALAFSAALDADFLNGSDRANTLTEKLVSELLQADEDEGPLKSLRTRLLVAQAVQQFGREQILDWVQNTTYFGNLVFGAGDAARYYFAKSVTELDLAEATFLAAVSKNPALDPSEAMDAIQKNQQELILTMLDQGFISEEDARNALVEEIRLQEPSAPFLSLAPDFTDLALQQLVSQFGEERVALGGLDVFTTLDLSLQSEIQLLIGDHEPEIVVLDSTNGQIIAMIGPSQDTSPFPGTILSPFVYLTAFANGYSPASLIWDIPSNLLPELPDYENADGKFHGPVNLRTALAQNLLAPTVDLLSKVGAPRTWQIAQEAGLRSLNSSTGVNNFDILLEGGRLSLVEVAQAYGTLANQGHISGQLQAESIQPDPLMIVRGPLRKILLDHTSAQTRSIVAPELAYLVTDVLSDSSILANDAKASALAKLDRSAALQMALSSDGQELLTVGYSPQLVVALWTQEDDLSNELVGALWADLFQASHRELPIQSWLAPAHLSSVVVCVPSGMLPSAECPETRREFFLPGMEPTQADTLYQRLSINRHSGNLATVFTQSDFIEERIFIHLPEKAEEWASQVGFAMPPADYDVIPLTNQVDDSILLLNPEAFASIRGIVRIKGTAADDETSSYRILIGEGLFPTHWIEIAQGTKIEDGEVLTFWDTQDLEGPYAIQLQLISSDSRVQNAFSLVTVDNQAPQLEIIVPGLNQELSASDIGKFVFRAQAEDNLSLKEVTFYFDETSIGSINEAPYEIAWPVSLGDHTLKVVAIDQAGNQVSEEISFEVLP